VAQEKNVQKQAITSKECKFCQHVTDHIFSTVWDNGWITYLFRCLSCGKAEKIEYDESRR